MCARHNGAAPHRLRELSPAGDGDEGKKGQWSCPEMTQNKTDSGTGMNSWEHITRGEQHIL